MKLTDREWKEFRISDIFSNSINCKPYHSQFLNDASKKEKGIPYITRTNLNNGLFSVVRKDNTFKVNHKNTISFGAENATYFYQPFEYITGNKMYYYKNTSLSSYTLLFLTSCLNKSIYGCGFGYGMGLTGSRSDSRKLMLPVTKEGQPDYLFMEDYIKEIMHKKRQEYIEYAKVKLEQNRTEQIVPLHSKKWKEFFIEDIFTVFAGKRLTKQNMRMGDIPFLGASDSNNGITNFIVQKNSSYDKNVLGVNYNGSVGEAFYHPYGCVFSDDVKRFHLKNYADNKNVLLFLSSIIAQQKEKYNYGYKFNETRMLRQYILLPVNNNDEPDYAYMEQYVNNMLVQKYSEYLDYAKKAV